MLRVAVTGGAGQIAYSLLFRIGSGEMFGKDTPLALHILEVKDFIPTLEGVRMELEDCAFPLLKEIRVGSDPYTLFQDIDYALLIGAKPRGAGMERKDLLFENAKIFIEQGKALNEVAKKETKVFVVGNPCNTNCWIAMHQAPKIPRKNFYAMTRLDQNRGEALLAQKARVEVDQVSSLVIWGNHSSTQVPDYTQAKILGKPASEVIDNAWLESAFLEKVQKRGAEVIALRGKSSAASAANALIDAVQDTRKNTPSGQFFSSCVVSDDNPYDIQEDLIFSFPCIAKQEGTVSIVPSLPLIPSIKAKIALTEKELLEERDLVRQFI